LEPTAETPWVFDRTGGHLALDFANSASNRYTGTLSEHLTSWNRVVAFAEQCGCLDEQCPRHPADEKRLVDEAIALREAIYATFAAVAEHREPPPDALAELNRWARRLELAPDLTWRWVDPKAPEAVLAPVVRAAIALLTHEHRERVHVCAADDCAWLFLDLSKNHTRRWCDMKQCGNRMKARRFRKGSGSSG
jgi:predicted RNA-binding Zn ribbon-like protein